MKPFVNLQVELLLTEYQSCKDKVNANLTAKSRSIDAAYQKELNPKIINRIALEQSHIKVVAELQVATDSLTEAILEAFAGLSVKYGQMEKSAAYWHGGYLKSVQDNIDYCDSVMKHLKK